MHTCFRFWLFVFPLKNGIPMAKAWMANNGRMTIAQCIYHAMTMAQMMAETGTIKIDDIFHVLANPFPVI